MTVHNTGLDRHHFKLNPEKWDEFNRVLDAPVEPDPRLTELFARPQRIQTNRAEMSARINRLFDQIEAE